MVLVLGCVLRFRLLQGTFKIGIYHKRDALLPAVVLEAQLLVILARQPDRAVVHLPAIHIVGLQFFTRAEVV